MTLEADPTPSARDRGPVVFVIILLVMAAGIGVGAAFPGGFPAHPASSGVGAPIAESSALLSFRSVSQLQDYMAANAASASIYDRYGGSGIVGGPVMLNPGGMVTFTGTMSVAESATTAAVQNDVTSLGSSASPSYTGTNVQVQGVDEPDFVKTDGTYLYVVANGTQSSGSTVNIIRAYPPGNASVLSSIPLTGQATGLETTQGRLAVVEHGYYNGTSDIGLLLYNTTAISSPKLIENVTIPGSYVAARMAQGYLYAVVQQPSYTFDGQGNATGVTPSIFVNGQKVEIPPSSVYYTPGSSQIEDYTMVVSIGMSSGAESTLAVLTGPSSTVYVSTSNIYVVYTDYRFFPNVDDIPGNVWNGGMPITDPSVQQDQNSTIFRASYTANGTVTVQAVGQVPGTILNQFSMDEYNGYFRVATSHLAVVNGSGTESDDVYVLNQSMDQVSAMHNIAPGENLYAVRFDGAMGYVVTFLQVDPLFAISFADITHPVIVSALKVNGYSDYLQSLFNGQYLLGVGKETVMASDGNFAYYLGLKLSLFHVLPNGTSSDVQDYVIGDRGTDSPVLTNHLALTYDPANNVTVIPVMLAQVPANEQAVNSSQSPPPFGNPVWQGAYVFRVNSTGLTLLGRVTQYPAGQNYGSSPDNNLQIERSLIIGSYLYTISGHEVMVSDLSSLSTVAIIPLVGG